MVARPARLQLAVLAALTLAACGSGDDASAGDPDAGFNCALDDRGETFVAGMSRTGAAGYVFSIDDALEGQPIKDDNTWTVTVTDPDAAPASALGLGVRPFMPDHGHGTPISPIVTAAGDGSFAIERINLWMPGLWEITLTAKDDATPVDSAAFRFCIDG